MPDEDYRFYSVCVVESLKTFERNSNLNKVTVGWDGGKEKREADSFGAVVRARSNQT